LDKDYFLRHLKPIEPPQQPFTFEAGDKVKAFECDGVVTDIQNGGFISVKFKNCPYIETFLPSGKKDSWHEAPSLTFVSRPKKKVKKMIKAYVAIDEFGQTLQLMEGEHDYKFRKQPHDIVELQKEVEVEG
jgi:hypothetical protein